MPHPRDGEGEVDAVSRISIALFQPDIAGNVGAVFRIGACFGVAVHVIEPCGFPFSRKAWARSALDYAALADIRRHSGWQNFLADRPPGRLVALTTRGSEALTRFAFRPGDTLLMGRETAGLPDEVHSMADARVAIPLVRGVRSLNVAVAAAVALHEALRQTGGLPG